MTDYKAPALETLTAAGEVAVEVEMAIDTLNCAYTRLLGLTEEAIHQSEAAMQNGEMTPDLAEAIAHGLRFIHRKSSGDWQGNLYDFIQKNLDLSRISGRERDALDEWARDERLRDAEMHDNPIAQLFGQLGR